MKKCYFNIELKLILTLLLLQLTFAQGQTNPPNQPNDFWKHVQFGGGIGLGFSSGYTDIFLAPSAIYNFNQYFSYYCELFF